VLAVNQPDHHAIGHRFLLGVGASREAPVPKTVCKIVTGRAGVG
jgi:hypothetical protein